MQTLQGIATNCQHTLRVSGGGSNTSTTTTYITLLRVDNRPMEMRTGRPTAISDGDQVRVAGLPDGAGLTVLACCNLTTGEVMNSGVWGKFFGAVLCAVAGVLLCTFLGTMFGGWFVLLVVGLTGAGAFFLVHRGLLTIQAEKSVTQR